MSPREVEADIVSCAGHEPASIGRLSAPIRNHPMG